MGVEVKILSGDNELVARKLCDELKIPVKKVLNGSDLSGLNWTEFRSMPMVIRLPTDR
jgi:Mg2+-importing ATPase